VDLALASVGLRDGRVDDPDHHRRDVDAGAVAFDVRNDGVVGYVEARILLTVIFCPAAGTLAC
jgi:hypothetical protein